MGFLSKWLMKKVRTAEKEEYSNDKVGIECATESHYEGQFGKSLQITVYNATGGKIVKFKKYNPYGSEKIAYDEDRRPDPVYIIHPDENVAEALSKLIVAEEIKGY